MRTSLCGVTGRKGANEGGGEGIIYIISENTALCALPANTVRSCLCAACVLRVCTYSCLCAVSLQFTVKLQQALTAGTSLVLSTARLYPFDSNVETHHPEHGSLPSSGFVPAGQTLSRGQTQHRSELSETEVFRRCMSKCSCSQSALGLCGLLPSLKGKATVVYVKDSGRVKWKWLLAKCT